MPDAPAPPDLLQALPLRPERAGVASDCRAVPFDRDDPRFGEPLVDLAQTGRLTEAWYARTDGGNDPYGVPIAGAVRTVAARAGVAARLDAADKLVSAFGARLKVVDAYRSVETQAGLWAFFSDRVARERPDLDPDARKAVVSTFVSDPRRFDPTDATTWPVHSTGGSVDILLVDARTGALLDHGAGFDEPHERSFTDHYERLLSSGEIAGEDPRLVNRRILVNAMRAAGFTNYAYEFWHFDYGTQLHVQTLRETAADAPQAAW